MLSSQFFSQDLHFTICLFAALVFLAVFWLGFDAWLLRRSSKDLFKWLGFGFIALSFVASATVIEQAFGSRSSLASVTTAISTVLRILGYGFVILGQITDPLQAVPESTGLSEADFSKPVKQKKSKLHGLTAAGFSNCLSPLLPLGALGIAILYYRRATTGLERHYRPVAYAFGGLFVYELLSLSQLWQHSTNPVVFQLVAPYAPLWLITQLILLASMLVLGRWVWGYLIQRFLSQLFIIFTSVTIVVFLLTTVCFTYLLSNNIQQSALSNLQTAAGVLNYALGAKQSQTAANASSIAENPSIAAALSSSDHGSLVSLTNGVLSSHNLSTLMITNQNGQVLVRAEDPSRYGDSLSSDSLVRRALSGTISSSIDSVDGVVAPIVRIQSAVPVRDSSQHVVGAIIAGVAIDNSFVDGIKQQTGLDSAIYAGDTRSATTITAPGSTSRAIGIKETNKAALSTVLKQHQSYKGLVAIQNRHYLSVYTPLKDVNNTVVGMILVAQPAAGTAADVGRSIELTFIITAVMLLLCVIPAYMVARYLASQLS